MTPNSPAERAGLKPGMRLTGANGEAFSLPALRAAVRATKGGSKTPLELWINEGPITTASKPKAVSLEGVNGEGVPFPCPHPRHSRPSRSRHRFHCFPRLLTGNIGSFFTLSFTLLSR